MWLDVGENGSCHVGIDAFMARLLGSVDHITFATSVAYPSAAISKGAVTWAFAFPNPVSFQHANVYLRSNPARLTCDCYGSGWLFSGQCTTSTTSGLIRGEEAARWMTSEVRRLSERVHELSSYETEAFQVAMNDGGIFAPGFVEHLGKDDVISLLHEFFGLHCNWN
jgi:glycine cleavage system H lipoate-binding protein